MADMEAKKKILIFSLCYFPRFVGGAEIAIKEITDRIDPSEIEFHMVTSRFDSSLPEKERIGNVLLHRIGFGIRGVDINSTHRSLFYLVKILFIPHAAWKAYRLYREHKYSGFWAMMLYMSFPIVLLRLFGIRVPYALTLQEGDPFEHVFGRWYIKLVRPLLLSGLRNATVIQTISTFLASWAMRASFKNNLVVIPNGVDIELFSKVQNKTEQDELREKLSKRAGETFLITTSRLVHKNAIDDVIRALPNLPSVRFLICGTGPDEKKLKELARQCDVSDRVEFLGQVAYKKLPLYLSISDVFIRASRSEGMGNSFIEAMAANLPVIGTNEGGIKDFLFDEKVTPDMLMTGWIVAKNTPRDIENAVMRILENPERTREVVEAAKKMVQERFDWKLVASRMEKEVFSVLRK